MLLLPSLSLAIICLPYLQLLFVYRMLSRHYHVHISISISISILLFKGLPLFGFLIFQFRNTLTPLYLCRNKTKGQYGKNVTLTLTKTLSKKQDKFPVNFQIVLSTYKLDFQNKNYIYKIKTQFFFSSKMPIHLYV